MILDEIATVVDSFSRRFNYWPSYLIVSSDVYECDTLLGMTVLVKAGSKFIDAAKGII